MPGSEHTTHVRRQNVMTVKDLREALEGLDDDLIVMVDTEWAGERFSFLYKDQAERANIYAEHFQYGGISFRSQGENETYEEKHTGLFTTHLMPFPVICFTAKDDDNE